MYALTDLTSSIVMSTPHVLNYITSETPDAWMIDAYYFSAGLSKKIINRGGLFIKALLNYEKTYKRLSQAYQKYNDNTSARNKRRDAGKILFELATITYGSFKAGSSLQGSQALDELSLIAPKATGRLQTFADDVAESGVWGIGNRIRESAGKSGIGDKITKILKSALEPAKPGSNMTRAGHAFHKHSTRNAATNPHKWGKVKGSNAVKNETGLRHFNEILNGPGKFEKVTTPKGITFLEKRLPDGRGLRLNRDGTFKGFID